MGLGRLCKKSHYANAGISKSEENPSSELLVVSSNSDKEYHCAASLFVLPVAPGWRVHGLCVKYRNIPQLVLAKSVNGLSDWEGLGRLSCLIEFTGIGSALKRYFRCAVGL